MCQQGPTGNQNSSYFNSTEEGVKTGGVKMIPISTPSGFFKVWTKRFGNNPKIKVLLLHGGPGCTHEYWECMESYLPKEGIEFIYYDQLGSAYSDQPQDSSLWTTERFVQELEQVRQALGLDSSNFYLLGHSWGGILAMEYALKHQENLKGLIISNMMASCPDYDKYADEVLAKQMDPAILMTIRMLEERNDFDNPLYMDLLNSHFYPEHVCRIPVKKWPEPMVRSFDKINSDVYTIMQGPSEFGISGRLANWDVTDKLSSITVPTLSIGATHDTMDPEHMKWISETVQNGEFLLCPNGSHMCMWDDQEVYMNGLISFLKKTNSGKKG
jgi:proline iminopeptidase